MVFSSSVFLFLFLPSVLLLYLMTPGRLKNFVLLLASLFFYIWGEHVYVLIMLGSTAIDYTAGLALRRVRRKSLAAKRILAVAVTLDLALLGYFKYAGFLLENLNRIFPLLGLSPLVVDPVHLPIGISFFTFQSMSYVVDVYRGDAKPQINPLNNGLYVSMFPQLIAGPIVRYRHIAEQLTNRRASLEAFHDGVVIFIIGLGKKMLIANPLGETVDQIFAIPAEQLTGPLSWLGVLCYSLQIYFDFSGYSDMAMGLGRFFGFQFPINFNYPYIALSMREFWQRWHITLSTWFRDYLYIPLGGNRHGPGRTRFNLLVVFFLCGFWHGASWNFIIWGLAHGFFLILERGRFGIFLQKLWSPARHGYVLMVVMLTWVLFRAPELDYAGQYLAALFGGGQGDGIEYYAAFYVNKEILAALVAGLIGSMPVLPFLRERAAQHLARLTPAPALVMASLIFSVKMLGLGLIFIACTMHLAAGTHNPFIYFRF